jgi:hypothetical protein
MSSLPHLDLVRANDNGPVRVDAHIRMDRIGHLLRRQRLRLQLRDSGQRLGDAARGERASGVVDRAPDARVGAAPAQVPVHPLGYRRVIRGRVRLKQRGRGQRLAGLTVPALDHVAPMPRLPDRVDDRTRRTFDRGDRLIHGRPGRGLARLCVAPVDQHRDNPGPDRPRKGASMTTTTSYSTPTETEHRLAIIELIGRLVLVLDVRDWETLGELFTTRSIATAPYSSAASQ